eukprot:6993427-Prymnesium_polylepis.1
MRARAAQRSRLSTADAVNATANANARRYIQPTAQQGPSTPVHRYGLRALGPQSFSTIPPLSTRHSPHFKPQLA